MFDDKLAAVLGIGSAVGGFGGLVVLAATAVPGLAIAGAAVGAVLGIQEWLTRKR